jgi:hypothetical protein
MKWTSHILGPGWRPFKNVIALLMHVLGLRFSGPANNTGQHVNDDESNGVSVTNSMYLLSYRSLVHSLSTVQYVFGSVLPGLQSILVGNPLPQIPGNLSNKTSRLAEVQATGL